MPVKVTSSAASAALSKSQARGLLPTALGSAEIRAQVAEAIRRNAVFSARTANAVYLQALKDRIARLLQGGFQNDLPKLRLELKQLLQRLGYTPETGFPGDEAYGIEPAERGSLKDLSSDARLNLILHTQEDLMRGAAQKARGNDGSRAMQFPAWELVRVFNRRVPRGTLHSGTKGWPARFVESGGVLRFDGAGKERLVAFKDDPVWAALGDSSIFSDALDVDHPPFAFNSGMGWVEVHHSDASRLGLVRTAPPAPAEPANPIPAPRASSEGLDRRTIASLKKHVAGVREKNGRLTMDDILAGEKRNHDRALRERGRLP